MPKLTQQLHNETVTEPQSHGSKSAMNSKHIPKPFCVLGNMKLVVLLIWKYEKDQT